MNEWKTFGKLFAMDGELAWGWHADPYGIHQERYISVDGEATKLVRDDGRESYDPPPTEPVRGIA